MDQKPLDLLLGRLAPLCEPIHDLLADAGEIASAHLADHDLLLPEMSWSLTHLVRTHAVGQALKRGGRIGNWQMLDPSQNGRFEWHNGLTSFRMLHDPVVTVPHPGHTRARRTFYLNQNLSLFGPASSKLLGLWTVDPLVGLSQIRVVRPVGHWRYRQRERIDLEFLLPGDGASLEAMEFDTADDLAVDLHRIEGEGERGIGEQSSGG